MLTTTVERQKLLSPEEALKRTYEDTERKIAHTRLPDHEAMQDVRRIGRPMDSTELIRRVQKWSRGRVWAEESRNDPSQMGFYFVKHREKTFVCAFPKGPMPEHSLVVTDAADVSYRERRGWRTVLTRLLDAGAMVWSEVKQGFGDTESPVAKRWQLNTKDFRR